MKRKTKGSRDMWFVCSAIAGFAAAGLGALGIAGCGQARALLPPAALVAPASPPLAAAASRAGD